MPAGDERYAAFARSQELDKLITEMEAKGESSHESSDDGLNAEVDDAGLYDGDDVYLFGIAEEATLTLNSAL